MNFPGPFEQFFQIIILVKAGESDLSVAKGLGGTCDRTLLTSSQGLLRHLSCGPHFEQQGTGPAVKVDSQERRGKFQTNRNLIGSQCSRDKLARSSATWTSNPG